MIGLVMSGSTLLICIGFAIKCGVKTFKKYYKKRKKRRADDTSSNDT